MKSNLIIFSVLIMFLSGCATVPMVVIDPVKKMTAIENTSLDSKKIYISGVVSQLTTQKIGQAKTGTLCVGGTDLLWLGSPATIAAMGTKIKETFRMYGYEVVSGLLESKAQKESDILIGVGISDIKANLCFSVNGQKGEVYVEVKWELYNKLKDETVMVMSRGTSKSEIFAHSGDNSLFVDAAMMATTNLLANQEIHKLITK